MNTKGMKFLAVLAVLAMAFAAFAVIAPTDVTAGNTVDTLSGEISIDTTVTIADGDKVTIDDDLTIDVGVTLTFEVSGDNGAGTVIALNKAIRFATGGETGAIVLNSGVTMNSEAEISGNGSITVNGGATFYTSKPLAVDITGVGNIVLDDAMETVITSGELRSDVIYLPTQKVVVTEDLKIGTNFTLTIKGQLVIPEGVTVTIANEGALVIDGVNASADVYGTIRSQGNVVNGDGFIVNSYEDDATGAHDPVVNIYGSLIAANSASSASTAAVDTIEFTSVNVTVYGDMTVSARAGAIVENLNIAKAGELEMNGQIQGDIYNSGKILINGTLTDASTIYIADPDAVISIDSLKGDGLLTVTDDKMYLYTGAKVGSGDYIANTMTFKNLKGAEISEYLKVTTTATSKTADFRMILGTMDGYTAISAAVTKDLTNEDLPEIDVTTGKTNYIVEDFKLSKIVMMVAFNAEMTVSGYVSVTDETVKYTEDMTEKDMTTMFGAGAGTAVTVYGTICMLTNEIDPEDGMIAVKYEVRDDVHTYYYYTTLKNAIDSGVKDLTVLGKLVIAEDTVIPAGWDVDASGKEVEINEDCTLTIENRGYLVSGDITVDGTLYVENLSTGLAATAVISDTSAIGDVSAMYTNIYNALLNATAGDVVKITKNAADEDGQTVFLTKDVSIKEGVTLQINMTKTLAIMLGVELTNNGIIDNRGSIVAVDEEGTVIGDQTTAWFNKTSVIKDGAEYNYAVITNNGAIVNNAGSELYFDTYKISGAYFTYNTKQYIMPVEDAVGYINDATDKTVYIYGDNTVDSILFAGTSSQPAHVIVMPADGQGNNPASTNFLATSVKATSFIVDDADLTIGLAVTVDGTFGTAVGTLKLKGSAGSYDGGVIVGTSNPISIYDTFVGDEPAMQVMGDFKGTATVDGAVYVTSGSYDGEDYGLTMTDTITVPAGTILAVLGYGELDAPLKVAGTVIVANGGEIKSKSTVVTGVLNVMGITEDYSKKGKATITDLFGGDAYTKAVSGTGTITGDGNYIVTNLYVFPGTTVEGEIIEAWLADSAVKKTELYVAASEGAAPALWMTFYSKTGYVFNDSNGAKNFKVSVTDSKLLGWGSYDSKTGKYSLYATTVKTSDKSTAYAVIDYYIYDVVVLADIGIDAVYIDGQIMTGISNNEIYGANANAFAATINAGQHVITYVLANGYSGNAVMTVDGDAVLGGYGFKTSGTEDTDVFITLTGIEKSGYDTHNDEVPTEPETWTITTILLLILVILIAIMAVIVAIRLNRS